MSRNVEMLAHNFDHDEPEVETGETLRISSIAATKAVNDLILTTTTSTTTQAGYSAGTGAYILEPEAFVVLATSSLCF